MTESEGPTEMCPYKGDVIAKELNACPNGTLTGPSHSFIGLKDIRLGKESLK